MQRLCHISSIICCLIVLISCRPTAPQLDLSVRQCASAPEGRACAAVFVVADKAYIIGGRLSDGTYCDHILCYNIADDEWTDLGAAPFKPRVNATACTLNGKGYVGLGFAGGSIYDDKNRYTDFWQFDPQNNQWQQLADFPSPNSDRGVALTEDGYIHIGYAFAHNYRRDFYTYDIADNSWQMIEQHIGDFDYPSRAFAACGATCSGRHFVGTGFRKESLDFWAEFFPQEARWRKCKEVPGGGRHDAACTATDNYIYVVGGCHYGDPLTNGYYFDDILRYSPATDEWAMCATIPAGKLQNMITFTYKGKVYFGLGEDAENNITDKMYCIEE